LIGSIKTDVIIGWPFWVVNAVHLRQKTKPPPIWVSGGF